MVMQSHYLVNRGSSLKTLIEPGNRPAYARIAE